jgi:hypothetical protein
MTSQRARSALIFLFLAGAAAGGCAGRPAGNTANRNTLTLDEMQQAGHADVFLTVQALRPQWLHRRGTTSLRASGGATIKVYLDDMLLGGPESMRQITTRSISSIRYYTDLEASERWGLDHGSGAIVVSTRR